MPWGTPSPDLPRHWFAHGVTQVTKTPCSSLLFLLHALMQHPSFSLPHFSLQSSGPHPAAATSLSSSVSSVSSYDWRTVRACPARAANKRARSERPMAALTGGEEEMALARSYPQGLSNNEI
uniref:Uncharacterized protein n=1 Tax=Alexandrium monilatum TaxID=311494 RepID=A0A7S4SN99_9DINO